MWVIFEGICSTSRLTLRLAYECSTVHLVMLSPMLSEMIITKVSIGSIESVTGLLWLDPGS